MGCNLIDKISWKMLYKDFRKTFPKLASHAIYWKPYDWMKIEVYFDEGEHFIYDGFRKTGYFNKFPDDVIEKNRSAKEKAMIKTKGDM